MVREVPEEERGAKREDQPEADTEGMEVIAWMW